MLKYLIEDILVTLRRFRFHWYTCHI